MLPAFAYARPSSLKQAAELLQSQGSQALAGGTDLLGCLREEIFKPDRLVSLGGLEGELRGVSRGSDGGLSIGPLTTISEIASHPEILKRAPALAQAASEVGSPQLRNQGTLGGNLCQKPRCWYYRTDFDCLRKGGHRCFALGGEDHYHCILGGRACYIVHPSDTAPALAALGGVVRLEGPSQSRAIPVKILLMDPAQDPTRETVLEPGEFISRIHLPRQPDGTYSAYRKVRARRSWDFALAGAAVVLEMQGGVVNHASVYLSGAAPYPWHASDVEEAVTGRKLDQQTIEAAAEAVVRKARPLTHNGYKIPLFKGVIRQELEKAAAWSGY
jgi:xanthine dehydrogenase YagS FAD-binding subunit